MEVTEFVLKLKSIPYSKDIYTSKSLSDSFIEDLSKCYTALKKNETYTKNDNPIIELIDNYIAKDINVCFISFYEVYEVNTPYIYFGSFDADILAINTQNQEVVLIDSQSNNDYILTYCAVSSSAFLDILVEAASFNEKKAMYTEFDNNDIILDKVNDITKIAGGNKYNTFSKLLVGYYD